MNSPAATFSSHSVPPILHRVGVILLAGGLAHAILWLLGVREFSERWHATLPFLWLLDWWLFSRLNTSNWGARLAAGAIALGVATLVCLSTALDQAHYIRGRLDASEVLLKVLLIASVFALFSFVSRGAIALVDRFCTPQKRALPLNLWLWRSAHALRIGLTLIVFAPYAYTVFNAHRTKIATAFDPQSALHLRFETVSFRAIDGVILRGWWIRAAHQTSRSILVCHGIGANKADFLGVAPFLRQAGYNVLFFDFRGHGDSGGHTTTFGAHEARDVVAAARWLQHDKAQSAVVLYGFSMGGAGVALSIDDLVGADSVLRGVIVDSTFADLSEVARRQMPLHGRAGNLFLRGVDWCNRWETGVALPDLAPRKHWAKLKGRPLLLIHGAVDQLIDVSQAKSNFGAATQPKTLMVVPKAGHCLCRLVDPKPYEKRVAQWLRGAFAQDK